MDKAKSKKSDKIPKPIKIKKEKTEENRTLQSMATYVDDRLELIKQIFSTLKPKTIVNLAPEYLKKKKMTKIEELCLTELVRLSKKRLLSIVNATKCPTDTESSEDSDVQPQEEHVSLEEVSSDSGTEGGEKKRKAKKKKMTKKDENNSTDAAKNKNNNENDGEGVISVLELLELQARARAIRSQLALEPVTKIEVDAEDPPPPKSSTAAKSQPEAKQSAQPPPTQGKEKERRRKRKSQDTVPTENGAKTSKENPEQAKKPETQTTNKEKVIPPTGKKIKLKRNYRNTNQNNIEKPPEADNKKKEEVKVERKSHSPSPDVIPILAEPETLTITDSSDEEKKAKIVEAEKDKGDEGVRTASVIVAPQPQEQQKEKPLSDIEDGEISDKEPTEVLEKSAANASESNVAATKQQQKPAVAVTSSNDAQVAKSVELTENADSKNSVTSDMGTPKVTSSVNDENSNLSSKMDTDDVADDDDDQDDVISIEGSDLETEITKHLETEKPKQDKISQKTTIKKEASESQANAKDNNNVSISSGDESGRDDNDADQQSWRSRYFKSTKVNKVLTASRLGKRVRDKIKKSKSAKKERDSEEANKAANGSRAKAPVFESKHEDGSVEQYKELLESTKRQSDSKKT